MFESNALLLVGVALAFAVAMIVAVVIERLAVAGHEAWLRRTTRHYTPLVQLALAGDSDARATLRRSPSWHRITIARMILIPLITDRDPARIADARELIDALPLMPFAERLLRSPWWWRRAMALRALGAMQAGDYTGRSSRRSMIRTTTSGTRRSTRSPTCRIPRRCRRSSCACTMPRCTGRDGARRWPRSDRSAEPFLLDLAAVDSEHRLNYALALGICGTAAARPILCAWSGDTRAVVRAAAMEALSRIGVDRASVPFAITALEDGDAAVRAMAATALHGHADRDTAASLARHLDDTWIVAVRAARSLQRMEAAGRAELEARAAGAGLAALLARQMLWDAKASR